MLRNKLRRLIAASCLVALGLLAAPPAQAMPWLQPTLLQGRLARAVAVLWSAAFGVGDDSVICEPDG
jgi:hypothetical protein